MDGFGEFETMPGSAALLSAVCFWQHDTRRISLIPGAHPNDRRWDEDLIANPSDHPVQSICSLNNGLLFLARNDPVPKWRNWQTRMVQVHVPARVWGFESLLRHQSMVRAPRFLTLWGFALKAPRKSNLIPEAIPGRGHPVSADAGGTPNALRVGRRCTRCGNRPRCRARGRSWQQ